MFIREISGLSCRYVSRGYAAEAAADGDVLGVGGHAEFASILPPAAVG